MGRFIWFLLFPFATLVSAEIAVVSLAAGKEFREVVQLGLKNKQDYCTQHGYDFICGEESLDKARGITWTKLLLLLKAMENSEYRWVFWTDADALIMNTDLLLEDLIDENYNLIINYDFNGFNAGHFLIRNCEWSRQFLKKAYSHKEFIDDPEWEQGAMLAVLRESSYAAATKTVPQRLMNSFPDLYGQLLQATYQPGDFILHFAGIREPSLLKRYFEHYYPLAKGQVSLLTYEYYLKMYDIMDLPKQSSLSVGCNWCIWSPDAQNQQYVEELAKHPEIRTIAQVGLSNGLLAELFIQNCINLTQSVAYPVYKRYDHFCRATCDYLSRKYRAVWKEAGESHQKIAPANTAFDLIHLQIRHADLIAEAQGLADSHTLVWIHDYNLPKVQQSVEQAVRNGILEVTATHRCGFGEDARAWAEAYYKFGTGEE